jgi:hypothetical protein
MSQAPESPNGRPASPLLTPANELDPDAVRLHVAMLDDRRRTSRFLKAIADAVRPGDVVVEIGTGTGVLAVVAAKAGAAHVYALEVANTAPWARRVFRANGVADRVTLVRGRAERLTLPERADLLIAELIGDDPLGEGIIGATRDAWRRFLKPNARLVPSAIAIYAYPVVIPEKILEPRVLRADRLERWREWYGVDFSPLVDSWGGDAFVDFVDPREARDWTSLGRPALVAAFDLAAVGQTRVHSGATVRINRTGRLDGLLLYCELFSGPRKFLSTAPSAVGDDNHWYTPLRILNEPVAVRAGDRVHVDYGHAPRGGGVRCSVVVEPAAAAGRGRRPRHAWRPHGVGRGLP